MLLRKEIGSEFWDVPLSVNHNSYFDRVIWFCSGRAAFREIIRQVKKTVQNIKIAMPSFLCDSMILPLEKENVDYIFYKVDLSNGRIQCDYSNILDCNVIFVIDYFGFESANDYPRDKVVIRDLTHSLFAKRYDDADYYFGSLRKWAAFCGAGFAFSKNGDLLKPQSYLEQYNSLRRKAFTLKKCFIDKKIESKEHLDIFHKAEEILEECEIAKGIEEDICNATHLDMEYLKTIRKENAKVLIEELGEFCIYKEIGENDCPLCVPIIYKNRDALRQYLISKDIYCPIHWPRPQQVDEKYSRDLYDNELSLVCDQRYTKEDMLRIVAEIKTFMEMNNNA